LRTRCGSIGEFYQEKGKISSIRNQWVGRGGRSHVYGGITLNYEGLEGKNVGSVKAASFGGKKGFKEGKGTTPGGEKKVGPDLTIRGGENEEPLAPESRKDHNPDTRTEERGPVHPHIRTGGRGGMLQVEEGSNRRGEGERKRYDSSCQNLNVFGSKDPYHLSPTRGREIAGANSGRGGRGAPLPPLQGHAIDKQLLLFNHKGERGDGPQLSRTRKKKRRTSFSSS